MHEVANASRDGADVVELHSPDGLVAAYAPGVGMVGCSLRDGDHELLGQRKGLAIYAESGSTFGIPLLHPWANRLAGFEYEAAGRAVEMDRESPLIRKDPNGLPIHGLVNASGHWSVTESTGNGDEARLAATLDFGGRGELLDQFPFPHELRVDIRLRGRELRVTTTLHATGDVAVPVSFGYHPYFTLPGVPREEWVVELPVTERLLLDDRMIPTGGTEPVYEPRGALGDRRFDDGYAGLTQPAVFALEGGGRRVEVEFDAGYPFAQVYAPPGQDLICFEPMTAPTNALVSGQGLPLVPPGETYAATFSIRVG
jgi:aldose 1-epimerase